MSISLKFNIESYSPIRFYANLDFAGFKQDPTNAPRNQPEPIPYAYIYHMHSINFLSYYDSSPYWTSKYKSKIVTCIIHKGVQNTTQHFWAMANCFYVPMHHLLFEPF